MRAAKPLCRPHVAGEEEAADGGALVLSETGLDMAWTALSGGSPYLAFEEAERKLAQWRPDSSATLTLRAFEKALIRGRANILVGYLVLFGLQASVLIVLVIGPLLSASSRTL